MPGGYPIEFRRKVLDLIEAGRHIAIRRLSSRTIATASGGCSSGRLVSRVFAGTLVGRDGPAEGEVSANVAPAVDAAGLRGCDCCVAVCGVVG